jgi:alanine racemase
MEEVKKYELKNKLKVHLKIDSGMGRIGVRTK